MRKECYGRTEEREGVEGCWVGVPSIKLIHDRVNCVLYTDVLTMVVKQINDLNGTDNEFQRSCIKS